MSVVDELEIELTANAKKANSAIDNLVTKLDTLSGSLSKIDGSRLSGLANGVAKLGLATKTLSGVKATDYNRIAKGFERFAKIDASKFSSLSGSLNILAKGLNAIGSVQNLGNITPSINAIKNLARVDMSGFDTEKLKSIASTLSSFATQLSGVGKIEGSVTRLVSSMARLSSSGQYIGNVATYFPQLGNQVVALVSKLSSAGAIDSSIAKIVDGIARLASAGKKVQDTVANLDKLGDGVVNLLNRLKSAPQINANIANTIQGLGSLASSGSRISTVSNSATTSSNKLGNALKNLKGRIQGAHKSSKGFVSSIGMFYAKMFLVIRAVKKFGQAIGSAQDYIEEFNYFSVALDKIGKDSANQFKKAGYNSAEEYAKSFRSRFSKLQTQLTGYKVDYDTGDATSQMTHNLGLDLTKVMNFNAAIAQITNSAGMLGETSIMTSKALSMLSADWSSLSNQDLSDVMNNMQSAIVGQSRAVYKFGLDITSAGLAQTALNHGIKVNIKDLDQQSKMQLRALTMLEQSKVAYGDLARTINQPANQLRMLRAGFQNLARTIGSLFMPIVQKLYPYLNAVVMVMQEFAQWVAKLAGIKLGDISDSVKAPETPDYSDAVDDSGKVADNMDKTAKKAKKASDNLQGFDIINKLQGNDSDTDTGAGNGKPNNTSLDLSKELEKALGNYENIWNNAFKSNQNKAVQLANKIKKALIDGWKKGDFSDVGKAFAQKINGALAKIPWAKIKETTKKIAKSIATFLNGFIKKLNWKLVGKTLAEGFNTAVDTLYTFVTTFNWLGLGASIAEAINSAVKNADFKKAGKLLGAKLRGMIQFAFGLLTNINYKRLGKKLGDAINGFFEDMGKVDKRTGLTGWQELGKSISDGIKGILDTIDTALSTVNWWEVGKSIGDFLGQIDWIGIFVRVGKVIAKALFSAFKAGISAFTNDPLGVGTLATVLASVFAYKKLIKALSSIKTMFGNAFSRLIVGSLKRTKIDANQLYKNIKDSLNKLVNKIKSDFRNIKGNVIVNVEYRGTNTTGTTGTGNKPSPSGGSPTKNIPKLDPFDWTNIGKIGSKTISKIFGKSANEAMKRIGQKSGQQAIKQIAGPALKQGAKGTISKVAGKAIPIVGAITTAYETWQAMYKAPAGGDIKLDKFTSGSDKASKSLKTLRDRMNKANISIDKQYAIIKKVNKGMRDGTIDTDNFSKISKKSFDGLLKNTKDGKISVDKITDSIKRLSPKKVKIDLKTSGEDKPKKIKNDIANIKDKEVKITATTSYGKTLKGFKKIMGEFKNKDIAFNLTPKLRKEWYKSVQKQLESRTFAINAKTTVIKSSGKEVEKATKSQTGAKFSGETFKKLMNKVGTTQDQWGRVVIPKTKKNQMSKKWKTLIEFLKKNGIATNNPVAFAKGGFPEDGWFRASKGEYFGQFDDGTSYISNNKQIENGIAASVAPAVHAAVKAGIREVFSEMPMQSGGDVYLDGVKVTKEIMSTAKKISKSTGVSWKMA